MSDPLDSINNTGKHWWQSKTIQGLIITGISVAAPKYQPIAQVLPGLVDNVATTVGLLWALYGRIRADKPINNPLP